MSTTLYLDESKSKGYMIVAATVLPGNATELRKALTELRMKGQRRIHFVSESAPRRRSILSAMHMLGVQTHVYRVEGATGRDCPRTVPERHRR